MDKTATKKTSQTRKKLVYPVFSECAEYTIDPYWQQVFEECGRGKFPKGSGYDAENEIVYFKNRNTPYITKDKNPKQIFLDMKKLFSDELNLKSLRDKQEISDEFDDVSRGLQETFTGTWQKIKRKKTKDPIIRRYILDLKEKYNLDYEETAKLARQIKLGFLFNSIEDSDVVYEDQKILDIKTLSFDPEERIFELDKPVSNSKREYKSKSTKLSLTWQKSLKTPRNRYTFS